MLPLKELPPPGARIAEAGGKNELGEEAKPGAEAEAEMDLLLYTALEANRFST